MTLQFSSHNIVRGQGKGTQERHRAKTNKNCMKGTPISNF